jgi:hypothetical protein
MKIEKCVLRNRMLYGIEVIEYTFDKMGSPGCLMDLPDTDEELMIHGIKIYSIYAGRAKKEFNHMNI